MKMEKEVTDAKNSNPWFWFGVAVCLIVAFDKGSGSRLNELKRSKQESARRNSLVSRETPNETEFVDIDPIEFEFAASSDGNGKSRGDRHVIVIDDKDGAGSRSSRNGKSPVVVETTRSTSESNDAEIIVEKKLEAEAERLRARVNASNAGKMEELERKLAEAGEKIRAAAERAGSRVSQRTQNVIVSRVLGENPLPPIPPIPPVPGPSGFDAKKKPEAQKFQVRSGPCATREKSIAEARTNLEKIVASRLTQYGLQDSEFVRKAVESLRPKFEVEESFREVGGDRYPLYVATVNVDLGTNFERQALRLVNQQTAHQRFAGLMGLSFGVVALLVGIDRMFLGRSGHAAASGKSLV